MATPPRPLRPPLPPSQEHLLRISPPSSHDSTSSSWSPASQHTIHEPITWLDLKKTDSYADYYSPVSPHQSSTKHDGKFAVTEIHEMEPSTTNASARSHHPLVLPPAAENAYRTYRRRWFGLIQLILLNIVVSWDWLTFAAVTKTAAQYFSITETAVTWISTGFLFAFVAVSPITMFTLHKGPKLAIITAAVLILAGNWIRYIGARLALFPVVMTGQILIGFAQPFVLIAPTRYSDLWFSDKGRTTATAIASLANPFGGALSQLLAPIWVPTGSPDKIPSLVLYVAIISSIAAIPSFFIPKEPPTPPSASAAAPKPAIMKSIRILSKSGTFYLIFIPFAVYVGFFNAVSSLLNQILLPYGYSETQAGIAGAILIVVGIIAAIIISIVNDRTHAYVFIIKALVPVVAASYLAFLFAPPTRTVLAPYVILAFLGAASFGIMPVALEYVCEVTYPVSPEVSSTIMWTAGQLLGAIFLIIMGQLKDEEGTDVSGGPIGGATTNKGGYPPGNMQRALVFQAIICCLIAVLPFGLGSRRLGLDGDRRKRFNADLDGEADGDHGAVRV